MITMINSLNATTFNAIDKLAREVKSFIRNLRSVRQSPLQLPSAKPTLENSATIKNSYSYIKITLLPIAETAVKTNQESLYHEPDFADKKPATVAAIIRHGNEINYDIPRLFTESEISLRNNIATQLNAIDYFENLYDEIPVKTYRKQVLNHENSAEKTGISKEKSLYVNLLTENNKPAAQKETINKVANHINAYYQQQLNILHQIIENQVHQINDSCAESPVKLKYTELAGVTVEDRSPKLPPRNKIF